MLIDSVSSALIVPKHLCFLLECFQLLLQALESPPVTPVVKGVDGDIGGKALEAVEVAQAEFGQLGMKTNAVSPCAATVPNCFSMKHVGL